MSDEGGRIISSHISRYPVKRGAIIQPGRHGLRKSICVTNIIGAEVGIVSNETIIFHRKASAQTVVQKEDQKILTRNSSSLNVVSEIMRRVVTPYLQDPSCLLKISSGLLLVGPPGTGKTYAVKAVQEQSIEKCLIRLVDLSIPSLLAHEDPIK
jgi:AAA+ superfamily predicted ATPase